MRRTVYAEVPPRVEYELTALGRTFIEPVAILCRWAHDRAADLELVLAARKRKTRKR